MPLFNPTSIGSGTISFIPKWVTATTQGNSILANPDASTITLGTAVAATDYALKFRGNAADGILTWLNSSNTFSITSSAGTAKLLVTSLTEQMRIAYDSSNYFSKTVDSVGATSLQSNGSASKITLIGGTAVGSSIVYKSTTGVGTTTSIAHQFIGGTNGATIVATQYNDGQFLIGTTTRNPTTLGILRINQGSQYLDIGAMDASNFGMWISTVTPSSSNYFIRRNGSGLTANDAVGVFFAVANATKVSIGASSWSAALNTTLSPPASTSTIPVAFLFTGAAHTTLTASTEVVDANWNLARNINHATGNYATQRSFLIQAPTHSFTAASTISDAATLAITGAPIVGPNASITNAYSIWSQSGTVRFDGNLQIIKNSEQFRVGFDASNYYTATVDSVGGVRFNAVGTGSKFNFEDTINVTSFEAAFVAKTANYTLDATNYTVEWTSGTVTGTLPTSVGITGRIYVLYNSGTGVITINTTSAQTISGSASGTLTLTQYDTIMVQSNGANWIKIN